MMNQDGQKEVNKEDFIKLLNTLYSKGYSGNPENWNSDCFLGWVEYEKEPKQWQAVSICVSYDWVKNHRNSIIFMFLDLMEDKHHCPDSNCKIFIKGIMQTLFPDMKEDLNNKRSTDIYIFKYD